MTKIDQLRRNSPRLAYMTGEYPRASYTFIQREVRTLREFGHHVQTFSVRRPAETEIVGAEGAASRASTIYLLPPRALVRAHLAQLLFSPKRYFSALLLALKHRPAGFTGLVRQAFYFAEAGMLARLMRQHSLRHLHNHLTDSSCSVAALAAAMGGFTFSFTMHGPMELYEPRLWWLDEKIRRALFVNCISHFCRSQGMLFSHPDNWHKLHIVHCGVELGLFEMKKHEGRGTRLLFVGRLAEQKGLPILLDALAKVEGATLDIAGDGPERKMLEEKVNELNIYDRVRILGYQSQPQVRALLRQADVFVMSSFAEGLPVVIMEAMAAGVPVVATWVAGVPEIVRDKHNGLLIPPGDATALAQAIRRLLNDPDLRNQFASAGREKIEQDFNIETEVLRLEKILTSALDSKNEGLQPTS